MTDKYYIFDASKQSFVAVKLLTLKMRVEATFNGDGDVLMVFRKDSSCTYKRADSPGVIRDGDSEMKLYLVPNGAAEFKHVRMLAGWTTQAGEALRSRGYWTWSQALAKPTHRGYVTFDYDCLNGTLEMVYLKESDVYPTWQAAVDANPVGIIDFEDTAPTKEYIIETTTKRTYKVSATSKDAALAQVQSGKVSSQEVETRIDARLKPSKKAPAKKASK